jgi:hypothetical protein
MVSATDLKPTPDPIAVNLRSLKKVLRDCELRQTDFNVEIKVVHGILPSF